MLDIELLYDLGLFIVPAALLVVATQKLRMPLIAVFFVSLGVQMELGQAVQHLDSALILA